MTTAKKEFKMRNSCKITITKLNHNITNYSKTVIITKWQGIQSFEKSFNSEQVCKN